MDKYKKLAAKLKDMLRASYPDIDVRVEAWSRDPSRAAIYFVSSKFAVLYPKQRYHYLLPLIPQDFYETHLANAVWFELAPGESPGDLDYPDEELTKQISPTVMKCVEASGFFKGLDDVFCPGNPAAPRAKCHRDFRVSKELLTKHGFEEKDLSDVFHVLMAKGGFCDCEILYNVVEESRLKAEYWKARAEGRKPKDPHGAS